MDRRMRYTITALGAAVITTALLFTVYAVYDLYPFGDMSISWCDMNQQVVPLLMDFKDILSGEGNIFLNMNNAGGMDFWGVFFFFLASPFSFLVVFVEKADMIVFMNILVLLKMAFSSATASLFFTRNFDKLPVPANVALSVSYGFCGFALMFYQNVIWLDMLWSFPLLLMSARRLLEDKKPGAFILMLSLSVVMNYYIGYMLVVFILIGMPLWILLCAPKEDKKQISLLFIISCIVAAMMTAVVWLPSLLQYVQSARGEGLIESLSSGDLYGSYTTKSLLVMCTPVIFAALPFISFKDAVNKRKLIWVLAMFLLTLAASIFEPINKMWHTGNYMSFPLRYGYMIIFLGLILAAHVINTHNDDGRAGGTPFAFVWSALSVFATYICGKMLTEDHFSTITKFSSSLWGDEKSFRLLMMWCLVGIFAAAALFALLKMRHISKQVFSVFLCLTVFAGCLFNGSVYMGSTARTDTAYRTEMDLEGRIDDESFYRVKTRNKYFVVNEIGAMGYNSLAHYTSLTDEDYMFAMKKLGYSSYWMEVNSNGGTMLTDAILRNNYTVSKNSTFNFSDNVIYQNDTYRIIKSLSEMPAGVKLTADPAEYTYLPDIERSDMQDYLYRLYTGSTDSVVTKYDHTRISDTEYKYEDGLYTFDIDEGSQGKIYFEVWAEGKQSLYFDAFKDISNNLREELNDSFSVSVDGMTVQSSYPSQSSNGLLYLGDYEDEYVSVTVTVKKDAVTSSFGVFSIDADKAAAACENIAGCDIKVDGNIVTAQAEGKAGEYLYLSLPCTEGYKVTVNGKEAKLYRVNDAFAAVALVDGQNDIVLTYLPVGFTPALVASIAGILLFTALILIFKFKPFSVSENIVGTVSFMAIIAALAAVIVLVYIFPIAVFALLGA